MKLTAKLIEEISINTRCDTTCDEGYDGVYTDSREVGNNRLFIPLIGEKFDGHNFIQQAIENGAKAALWQKDKKIPSLPENFQLYFVEDTLTSLQALAKKYLQKVNPIVIGVTGSNGKTTTKDIASSIFSMKYKTYKTQGNFNNHIGLPLTILQMPVDCELLILEMGMNHFGEISLLSNISEPNYCIITNIGESHIENLGNREGIAKAKMEIITGMKKDGKLFFDGDEPLLKPYRKQNVVTCGYKSDSDVKITNMTSNENGFTFTINDKPYVFELPLLGRHNLKNASYVIACAKELGFTHEEINQGLKAISITKMRFEKIAGKNGSLIINDAYNASPTSMKAAIETVKELNHFQQKILVLGDMYELGSDEEQLHRSVSHTIRSPITHLFAVGQKGKWIGEQLKEINSSIKVEIILEKENVATKIIPLLNKETVVLIKASRGHKLETVVDALRL